MLLHYGSKRFTTCPLLVVCDYTSGVIDVLPAQYQLFMVTLLV